MSSGRIVEIIGAVIDVEFNREEVPRVYDALTVNQNGLTLEVQQQLGDGIVRTIAMGVSDGLSRGLEVSNTGDRPIQVGSHYHFFETNENLKFDRKSTRGMRLDIISGTAIRFEPGQSKTVGLIPYGGKRKVYGFNKKIMGDL